MIVVNSVMEGFAHEMQGRIHGILSDVVVESHSLEGFADPQGKMERIRRVAGKYIAGMTPTVVVPAMLVFEVQGQRITRQVNLIGVDEKTHSSVSDFGRYLQHPENRKQLNFELRDGGYDDVDHQAGPESPKRERMQIAGWEYRRMQARFRRDMHLPSPLTDPPAQPQTITVKPPESADGGQPAATDAAPPEEVEYEGYQYRRIAKVEPKEAEAPVETKKAVNPFTQHAPPTHEFDPAKETYTGLVMGIALASYRAHDGGERFLILPGEDVKIMLPTVGAPPKAVSDSFTIVDFYESKMSEYDSSFVFMPIEKLQAMRGMIDPSTQIGNVTSIQIKLHRRRNGPMVRNLLQQAFEPELFGVQTWRDKQGPLLAAVQMETAILNVLLFMIIAVAGFGILAIFYMIVVEKTRDIGILKSLGAPSRGIMGIFLAYGVSLGVVGSGAGMILGLVFVAHLNRIADYLAWITGQPVFDPSIYYFQEIPTIVEPFTVSWIVAGAVSIAVMASILPARRARPAASRGGRCAMNRAIRAAGAGERDDRPAWRVARPARGDFGGTSGRRRGQCAAPIGGRRPVEALSQGARRDTGAARRRSRSAHGGVLVDRRPERLRQEHTVALASHARRAGKRRSPLSRSAHRQSADEPPRCAAQLPLWHDLSVLSLAARTDGARERAGADVDRRQRLELLSPPQAVRRARARIARDGRAWQAVEAQAARTVGRRNAARSDCASAGDGTASAVCRRADWQSRCQDRGRDLRILRTLNDQRNLTIVMVTHDRAIAQQADRTVRLVQGQVEAAGLRRDS